MSALFDRLTRLFDDGHGVELPGLLNQGQFAPPELRPAAVLIARIRQQIVERVAQFLRQHQASTNGKHVPFDQIAGGSPPSASASSTIS